MSEEVIIERIDNLKEFFKEEFDNNKSEHKTMRVNMEEMHEDHEKRLRKLEDWKLVFVAKFSIITAIALTVGSLVGTVLINWFGKLF